MARQLRSVVYVVDAVVEPTAASELYAQFPDARRALITAFVKSTDALEAGHRVRDALEANHYRVASIEEIVMDSIEDRAQWEPDVAEIIAVAENDTEGDVYFGSFYCYVDEDSD